MQIRLAADLQSDSIVDGEGIRTVIWTQGCPHNCTGCHNPLTHDFNGGEVVDIEDVYNAIDELEGQDGITFSGGDPFMQAKACAKLAKYAKSKGYNIWCYTGFRYEELLEKAKKDSSIMDFLKQVDILVDGRFVLSLKSYNLLFRGSSNQRIINVPLSLIKGEVVLEDRFDYKEEVSHRTRLAGIYV